MAKGKHERWSKERIIAEIIRLYKEGVPLDITNLRACGKNKLVAAGYRHFGSWRTAIEAAGLDSNKTARIKPRNWWNKDRVIHEILLLRDAGLPLNASFILSFPKLKHFYRTAIKFFDGWENFLKAVGIDPEPHCKRKKWSPGVIVNMLRDLHNNGETIYFNSLKERGGKYRNLTVAGISHFGSWDNALLAAGFNADEIRKSKPTGWWTKEKIIDEIQKIDKLGISLHSTFIRTIRRDLYEQAYVYFDGWIDAVYSAGVDYLEHCTQWSTRAWLRKLENEDIDKLKEQVLRIAEEMVNHKKERKGNERKFTKRSAGNTIGSGFRAG